MDIVGSREINSLPHQEKLRRSLFGGIGTVQDTEERKHIEARLKWKGREEGEITGAEP